MFRGEFMDMSASQRHSTIARLWKWLLSLEPHPHAMYEAIDNECPQLSGLASAAELADYCQGMNAERVGELASDPLFEVGIHTADHPYLSRCTSDEVGRQIQLNQQWIEKATGRSCRLIAYPLGDFNAEVFRHCRALNVDCGFSAERRISGDSNLQLPRVGVYQPSLDELGFKVYWGSVLTRFQSHGYFVGN